MTKRHRKQGMEPVIHYKKINSVTYSVDQTDIDNSKDIHGIDLIAEIEQLQLKEVDENKRTEG